MLAKRKATNDIISSEERNVVNSKEESDSSFQAKTKSYQAKNDHFIQLIAYSFELLLPKKKKYPNTVSTFNNLSNLEEFKAFLALSPNIYKKRKFILRNLSRFPDFCDMNTDFCKIILLILIYILNDYFEKIIMNLCDIFAELILYIAFFLLLVNNKIITSLNTSKNRREREENIFLGYLKGVTLPNCHISFKNCLFGRKYDIPNIFDYSYGKKNKNNDNTIVRNAEHRNKKYDTGNINLLAIFKSVNKCKKDELFKKILYVNEQR